MNYEFFVDDDEVSFDLAHKQIKINRPTTLDQLRIMYQVKMKGELTYFQSIYVVYFEGIENIEQAIDFIKNNESHNYIEYQTPHFCGVCQKKREAHIQNLIDPQNNIIVAKVQEYTELLNQMKHCVVCYELFTKKELAYINFDQHEICQLCFRNYIETQILEGRLNQIFCPHCNIPISSQYLAQSDPVLYEKYLKVQKNQEILQNPNKAWCPNIHCSNIVEFKSSTTEEICKECKISICKICKQRSHPQMTCEENIQQELNEWQQDRDTQQCPRCKIIVEKINGCNHMTCQFCKHEWCWICGSDYSSIHYAIFNPFGCPALMPGWIRQKDWSYTKLFIWRFLCFILLLLFTPVFVIVFAPAICIAKLIQSQFYKFRSFCTQIFLLIITFITGILLIPFCVVLFIICIIENVNIIVLLPGIVFVIGLYYTERQRLEIRHKNAMSRHFQNV